MTFRMVPFIFIFLLLAGCTTLQPENNGYFPIPEKFTGVWELKRNGRIGGEDITIEKTSTGALITEPGLGLSDTPIIYQTTLNVFAYENNHAYAIGEDRTVVRKTGNSINNPHYKYYVLEYKQPKYLEYINEMTSPSLYVHHLECRIKLSEKDMSLSSEIHWQRMHNTSCTSTPQTRSLSSTKRFSYAKKE